MPRQARLDPPDALQHVMARGVNGRPIFRSDRDRAVFLDRVGTVVAETGAEVFAWALMPNHVHLLLTRGRARLGTLLQRLLGRYAQYFNAQHRRRGHVFQNRYKSVVCQSDEYLQQLVRYIHLNPVDAGLVRTPAALDRYRWTGHAALLGQRLVPWQATEPVLALFGKQVGAARRAYRAFVLEGWNAGRDPRLAGGGLRRSHGGGERAQRAIREAAASGQRLDADERVLGEANFVREALAAAEADAVRDYPALRAGWTAALVLAEAGRRFGLAPSAVRGASKEPRRARARALACAWLLDELGLRPSVVADLLGVHQSAVRRAAARAGAPADRPRLPRRPPRTRMS